MVISTSVLVARSGSNQHVWVVRRSLSEILVPHRGALATRVADGLAVVLQCDLEADPAKLVGALLVADLVDAEAEIAGCRLRTAAAQPPPRRRPSRSTPGRVRLRAADGDDDVVAVAEVDVGPVQAGDLAAAEGAVEEQGDDRAVDQAGSRVRPTRRNPSSACRVEVMADIVTSAVSAGSPVHQSGPRGRAAQDVAPFITHRLPSPDIRTATIGVRHGISAGTIA